jgi:hypothetical protein
MIEPRAVIVCGGAGGLLKTGETARAAMDATSSNEGSAALWRTA